MNTYIMLINWTDKGAVDVRASPGRLDAAKKMLGELGGSFKSFYMTMGKYDLVAVVEAPDDEALARLLLKTGMGGSIRTHTMKAFPEAKYREIFASLG